MKKLVVGIGAAWVVAACAGSDVTETTTASSSGGSMATGGAGGTGGAPAAAGGGDPSCIDGEYRCNILGDRELCENGVWAADPCVDPPSGGVSECQSDGTCLLVCDEGLAPCGDVCADLSSDTDHCGACGYGAVRGRVCVDGKPSPGWLVMGSANGPTAGATLKPGWNGEHLVHISDTEVLGFDPATDMWAALPAPPTAAGTWQLLIALPHHDRVVLLSSGGIHHLAVGASSWSSYTTLPAVVGQPYAAVIDDWLYIFDREAAGAGYRLDVSQPGATWENITTSSMCTLWANGAVGGSVFRPTTGRVIQLNSSDIRNTDLNHCGANQWALTHDVAGTNWAAPPHEVLSAPARYHYAYSSTTVLSLGDRLFVSGGWNAANCGTGTLEQGSFLYTPLAGDVAVSDPNGLLRSGTFTAFTGRSIFHWGGWTLGSDCSSYPVSPSDVGGIGVVNDLGTAIAWQSLPPVPGTLSGRGLGEGAHNDWQSGWTGREVLVYGGRAHWGNSSLFNGAGYQPPVGCVCPTTTDKPTSVVSPCSDVDETSIAEGACIP